MAMALGGQQWILKNIVINGANTGIVAGAFNLVVQGCTFENGAVGIEASGVSGSLTVIDTTGSNMGTLISSNTAGGSPENSMILENVQMSGNTVTLSGSVVLTDSVTDTWMRGNEVSNGSEDSEKRLT